MKRLSIVLMLAVLIGCGEREERDLVRDSIEDPRLAGPQIDYTPVEVANGGRVVGRVLLDGAAPEAPDFAVPEDATLCLGAVDNDRLLVGPDGGLGWAVVRLVGVKKGKPFPTLTDEQRLVDQIGCRYTPHVVALPVGTEVLFRNSDPTPHNVRVEDTTGAIMLNVAQPAQGSVDILVVDRIGPMSVGCDYHPWMNAYVFGVDNPYVVVTGADGAFELTDVPPGEYELRVWLNGFTPQPMKDNNGAIIRYRFSEAYEVGKRITVAPGGEVREEIRIAAGR